MIQCMRRKQLYIDEAQDRALKRLSAQTGRTEAHHVRAALDQYLAVHPPTGNDPFEALIGLVEDRDGPTDVALNHDHYLYGGAKTAS